MNKLKKTAAVAVMVGGLGLVGSGVAGADDGPFPFATDNLQVVKCDQAFEGGLGFAPVTTGPVGGDYEQNIGNFCTAANVER